MDQRENEDNLESTTVTSEIDTRFAWDYMSRSPKIRALYEKGKAAQWNAVTDIEWSDDIEFGAPLPDVTNNSSVLMRGRPGCPIPDELWHEFHWECHAWLTSQFMHGEQGALLATARLVETVPDLDAKLYAAAQVADEARHVEAYAIYVRRLGHRYPVNPSLKQMLSSITSENRWDIIYLGMQVIIEGLALAAFRLGTTGAVNAVIRQINELVARDEARHVAFGMLALNGLYDQLTSRERAEREDFVMEAALLTSRRLLLGEIWERLGLDGRRGVEYAQREPMMIDTRQLMFARVARNLQHLGVLTPRVRAHLRELSLLPAGAGRTA